MMGASDFRKNTILAGAVLLATGLLPALCPAAVAGDAEVKSAVESYLKEQTKYSGTLDLYDETLNAVRNLRATGKPMKVEGAAVILSFRDVNSGDIVVLEFAVKDDAVTGSTVKSVTPPKGAAAPASEGVPAEFSDEAVQAFMRSYLEDQAKFTGYISLFDPEKEKMLKLELIELDPEVRRMGKFAISRGTFKDTESGSELGIDLTTEPKGSSLSMQSLRIRER